MLKCRDIFMYSWFFMTFVSVDIIIIMHRNKSYSDHSCSTIIRSAGYKNFILFINTYNHFNIVVIPKPVAPSQLMIGFGCSSRIKTGSPFFFSFPWMHSYVLLLFNILSKLMFSMARIQNQRSTVRFLRNKCWLSSCNLTTNLLLVMKLQ